MLKLNINQAKSGFFDRPINEKLDRDAKRGLSKFGAYTRRAARTRLKKARRKKLTEMTTEERQRFHISAAVAQKKGKEKPKRPYMPSEQGQPPRMREGLIRKFLFFTYDPSERSVVTGPATISNATGAPETLEKGGFAKTNSGRVRIEQRPYMLPAFDDNIDKLPGLMRG